MSLGDDVDELQREMKDMREKVAVLWAAYQDIKKLLLVLLGGVALNAMLQIFGLIQNQP